MSKCCLCSDYIFIVLEKSVLTLAAGMVIISIALLLISKSYFTGHYVKMRNQTKSSLSSSGKHVDNSY